MNAITSDNDVPLEVFVDRTKNAQQLVDHWRLHSLRIVAVYFS